MQTLSDMPVIGWTSHSRVGGLQPQSTQILAHLTMMLNLMQSGLLECIRMRGPRRVSILPERTNVARSTRRHTTIHDITDISRVDNSRRILMTILISLQTLNCIIADFAPCAHGSAS